MSFVSAETAQFPVKVQLGICASDHLGLRPYSEAPNSALVCQRPGCGQPFVAWATYIHRIEAL